MTDVKREKEKRTRFRYSTIIEGKKKP